MSKVRCANPACRQYRYKETCVRFGLSWCCDRDCLYQASITRRKVPEWKQPAEGPEGARGDLDAIPYNARSTESHPGAAGSPSSPSSPSSAGQLPKTRTSPSPAKRRAILKRDGKACRGCGSSTNLHVHHIEYRSEGGGHVEGNLVTLCLGCHDMVHSRKPLYQPALKEMMRQHYQLATFVMLPEALLLVARREAEADEQPS